MSKPAQSPKQQLISNLLLITTLFLLFQLIFNSNKGPQDTRTADVVLQSIRSMNKENKDFSIVAESRIYESKIDAEVKAGTLSQDQATALKFESSMLVADTQLRGGLQTGEINRLDAAYQTLHRLRKQSSDKPMWKEQQVTVAPMDKLPQTTWTGEALYQTAVATLSEANRNDLVAGFIPGFALIDFLVHLTGANPSFSYALAALILATFVRGVIWPMSQKQMMWSRQMQQLSPLINEIKDKFKDQPTVMQAKTMELYKEYGINPMAGCVPAMIQLPFFLTVYRCMLHYRFEFQKGFFFWISPGTSQATHGFFAPNLGEQDNLLIGLYLISMVISTYLQPITNPDQAKQQRMMGIIFALMFGGSMFLGFFPVPAAFVLYWTFTNIFATIQSLRAYRLPMPPLEKKSAPGGGFFPKQFEALMQQQNGVSNGSSNGVVTPKLVDNNRTGKPIKHKPKKRK
ncbi:MAG: membrane protein insertase YidC [Armatimonadetes bacterium]|nr:membrane protein insertase YidC [Armatimonadota bacterium]